MLIFHTEMMQSKAGYCIQIEPESFQLNWCEDKEGRWRGGGRPVSEGRDVISCFLILRHVPRCRQTDTHCHLLAAENTGKVLCGTGRTHWRRH